MFNFKGSTALVALGVGSALAPAGFAETVTWSRMAGVTIAPLTLPAGSVVLTRVLPTDPNAPTVAELQARLTEQQQALVALEREQKEVRTYAEMQAQLAQAKAEKEAIAVTMAAATQHVATQTAATEARLREETKRELAGAQTIANIRLRSLEDTTREQLTSLEKLTDTRYAGFEKATVDKLASLEALTGTKLASLEKLTDTRLSGMEQLTRDNRAIAEAATTRLSADLTRYADAQMKAVQTQTAESVAALANNTRLQDARLKVEMQQNLNQLYAQSKAKAAELAEAKTSAVAQRLAALQQEVTDTRLSEAQVKSLATQALDEATPQLQAIALQTLKDAKGYVSTIARSAVTDGDPAVQQALTQAVAKALDEESPAKFSMRKAIVDELTALSTISGTTQAMTRLGNDIEPAAGPSSMDGEEIALDAARLRLGRLMAPGAGPVQTAALLSPPSDDATRASIQRGRMRTDLMNIRDYKVVVHSDNQTLPDLLQDIAKRAEPFAGPWQIKWKVKPENEDLLTEKFSLDAETTFGEFVGYLAQFMVNDRGVKLTFSLFDRERVMLVSD